MSYLLKRRHHCKVSHLNVVGLLVCLLLLSQCIAMAGSEREGDSEEIEYRNKIGLFGGVTQEGADIGPSIGLEYTYRLWKHFSIGVLGERAGGDFDLWLLGADFIIHPYAGWLIRLVPCVEFEDSEEEGSETRAVFRAGIGYDFEIASRWSLSPEINVDFNRREKDHTFVYGVTLLYSF